MTSIYRASQLSALLVASLALVGCKTKDVAVDGPPIWFPDGSGPTYDAHSGEDVELPPPGFPPAKELYDPLGIHEVKVVVPAATWKVILDNAKDTELVRQWHLANVIIDGTTYENVGIKNFGDGSQQGNPGKPNVRIKFNQFVDKAKGPEKMRNIRLKASGSDRSFVREPLFYAMSRAIGLAAPRTSYARVRINDEVYGLYQVLEQADKRLFNHNFGNTKGLNFDVGSSCNGFNCPKGNCPKIIKYFEINHDLVDGAKPDFSTVIALATAIDEATEDELASRVGKIADMDNLLGIYAMEAMASDHDGLSAGGANFELYQDLETGLMHVIRNGADGSFKSLYELDHPWGPPNTWCSGRKDKFYSRASVNPGLRKGLDDKFRKLQCGPFAKTWYLPWLEARRQLIIDELGFEGEKAGFHPGDAGGQIDDIIVYLVGRAQMIGKRLGPCP